MQRKQEPTLAQRAEELAAVTDAAPPPGGTWQRSSKNIMSGIHVDGRQWLYCECQERGSSVYKANLVWFDPGSTFVNLDGRLVREAPEAAEHERVARAREKVDGFEQRMRAAMKVASRYGAGAGFPNFHQARRGNNIEFGIVFLDPAICKHADIPSRDVDSSTCENLFRSVHDYARRQDYGTGFPTFINTSRDTVGIVLINKEATVFHDVPLPDLSYPSNNPERYRNTNTYAGQRGFGGGQPTFHQARRDGVVVHGTMLFLSAHSWQRDVTVTELASA